MKNSENEKAKFKFSYGGMMVRREIATTYFEVLINTERPLGYEENADDLNCLCA